MNCFYKGSKSKKNFFWGGRGGGGGGGGGRGRRGKGARVSEFLNKKSISTIFFLGGGGGEGGLE